LIAMREALALSWSGGKDSALALWKLRRAGTPPALLLTTYDEQRGTIPHHGVPLDLVREQAAAVGMPLAPVAIPPAAANETYEDRLRAAFAAPPLDAVGAVAFGDLFLGDLRRYREQKMTEAGLEARFPLWGSDTHALARSFVAAGFRAVIVSVDRERLPTDFLGRELDDLLLDALPPRVDPCGENGEFHSFVYDGPVFREPLAVEPAARREDGRWAWLELSSAPRAA
jgi:uncharacterized protein (TIGR00290 family)